MARLKKVKEMLLTCFWMNIQRVPLEREKAIYMVTSTHRAPNKKSHHNAASVLLSISSDKEDKIRKLKPQKKYHLIVFQIMSGILMMASNW